MPNLKPLLWAALLFYAVFGHAAETELSLRAGIYAKSFPEFSVEDMEISIKVLAQEIGQNIGIKTDITVYENIDAMRSDFEQVKLNFVIASSLILATKFDTQQLAAGLRFMRSNGAADQMLVLVQKKSGQLDFKKFRGERLVLAKNDPVTELYIDYLARSEFRQGYKDSFKVLPSVKKSHQLILNLFFDQADITSVFNNAYQRAVALNPQLLTKLQIIAKLDGIPQAIGLFHKNTPLEFRDRVIAKAIKLTCTARGKQLLQLFKSDQAVRSSPADLLTVKKLFDAHQKLLLSQ